MHMHTIYSPCMGYDPDTFLEGLTCTVILSTTRGVQMSQDFPFIDPKACILLEYNNNMVWLGISADLKIHPFSFEALFSFETLATLTFQMKRTAANEQMAVADPRGGSGGSGPPLRFPGKISCTWKNSLYLLKNSVKICMSRSIS